MQGKINLAFFVCNSENKFSLDKMVTTRKRHSF